MGKIWDPSVDDGDGHFTGIVRFDSIRRIMPDGDGIVCYFTGLSADYKMNVSAKLKSRFLKEYREWANNPYSDYEKFEGLAVAAMTAADNLKNIVDK
jgi:hypothetical protein